MQGEKRGETEAKILADKTSTARVAEPIKIEDRVEEKASDDDPLHLNTAGQISLKEQREKDWNIIRKLLAHIWPRGDRGTKIRVILALALLIGGKVSKCPMRGKTVPHN
jgi:ATP-binding cassette subfamily B (MDR/TAP) protein 7